MNLVKVLSAAAWILTAAVAGAYADSPSSPLLGTKPEGAVGVISARKDAKDGDVVVVVGRIGGDPKPFVNGAAGFTIVDESLKPCADDEGCETPWDYCCETDKLPKSKALIKVVDADGKIVRVDSKKLLGVKELSTVAVRGKARRDKAGNLTILATGVFVQSK
jgi:hypothetical protein